MPEDGHPTHAGGVVFRTRRGKTEYLLVEATDDPAQWVLPKGHVEEGEQHRETAVREVHEETGVWARIVGDLGEVSYSVNGAAKLKSRELDLRAMDNSKKREQDQEKINMDKSKQMMGQEQFDEKLEQNEDLAELRAETSLTKQEMSNDAKMRQDRMKQRDVRILKGPRR